MDAVQKQVEDIKAAKLSAAKTNADTMHLYAATALEQGTMAQQQVDNFAPTLKIATDHDQNLQPGDQKAVLASGMTSSGCSWRGCFASWWIRWGTTEPRYDEWIKLDGAD